MARSIREILADRGVAWGDAEVVAVINWLCRYHGDKLIRWASKGIWKIVNAQWPAGFERPDQATVQAWAEDAVADALLKLCTLGPKSGKRGIDSWNPSKSLFDQGVDIENAFLVWTRRIMIRAGGRHARRQVSERVKRERAQREAPVFVDPDDLTSTDLAELIRKWIDRAGLTPPEREAIELVGLNGLSHEEAARQSQYQPVTADAMRGRYHRAITKLRNAADKNEI